MFSIAHNTYTTDAHPSPESGGNFFDMSKAFFKEVFKYYDHNCTSIETRLFNSEDSHSATLQLPTMCGSVCLLRYKKSGT